MADKSMNNVDQIRDLIFGSQLKEFDERFETLNKTIRNVEEKMVQTFKEAHVKLQRETERSVEALEQKIDNLSTITQKERNKLKELIDTTEETLQVQIKNQKDEFLTKLKIMKENMEDENEKINQNLTQMRTQIENMLHEGLSDLGEEKLSRDMMAGMLLDVAMKIQGTDVNALLTQESKPETK